MYTTKGKIQNYLLTDIDESFDDQINDWISAAEIYINNYTGVKDGFESGDASDKYFDGKGGTELDIDEFTSINSVQILEINSDDVEYSLSEGKANDYVVYPYNENAKYRLSLVPNAQISAFPLGKKRIKINAVWGSESTVPKDIELATTILVSSIIEKGLSGGKVASETLGDYSVSFENIDDSDQALGVKRMLDKYKKFEL